MGMCVRVCMHLSLGVLSCHLSCFIKRGYLTVLELTDWNELAGRPTVSAFSELGLSAL